MTESIGTARLDIVVDTTNMEAGVAKAKRSQEDLAQSATKAAQKSEQNTRRQVASLEKQIATLGKSREEVIRWRIEQQTSGKVAADLASKLDRQVSAMRRSGVELNRYGVSARQQAAALRGVPAQITDIFTSLASGQRPMMVLLQQGGQLKDMFGGIRPAATALAGAIGSLINPATLAAAAIAALGLAWKRASDEADAFNRAVILSGNFARTSTEDLERMARKVAESTDSSLGKSSEVVAQLAATGRFTAEQIEGISVAAIKMQAVTGRAIDDTVNQFLRLADDPARAIEELNKAQHLLSDRTKAQVRELQEQGKSAQAASLAIEEVVNQTINRADQVERHLSLWADLWLNVSREAGSAGDTIAGVLRDADRQFQALLNSGFGRFAIRPLLPLSQDFGKASDFSNVVGQANTVAANFARTRGLPENFGLNVPPPPKEEEGRRVPRARQGARGQLPDFRQLAEQELRRLIESTQRADEQFQALAATLAGPLKEAEFQHEQALRQIEEVGKQAGRSSAEIAAAKEAETRRYEEQTAVIKRQLDPVGQVLDYQRLELDLIGKSNAERGVMNALLEKGVDLRSQDAQAALAQARANQTEAESRQRSIDLMDDFRSGASDAFADLVTGAKSAKEALGDFFDELFRQAARAAADQWIAKAFGAQGSDGAGTTGGGWLSAILGGGSGSQGSLIDLFSGSWGFAKGAAFAGGNVVPFASGGVVTRPTFFGMSGGRMGVMGEERPEAIVPLHRGPDGKLGIRMERDPMPKRLAAPVINQVINVQGRMDNRTPEQIARASGREINRAARRS